jgi:hypothetical protein
MALDLLLEGLTRDDVVFSLSRYLTYQERSECTVRDQNRSSNASKIVESLAGRELVRYAAFSLSSINHASPDIRAS